MNKLWVIPCILVLCGGWAMVQDVLFDGTDVTKYGTDSLYIREHWQPINLRLIYEDTLPGHFTVVTTADSSWIGYVQDSVVIDTIIIRGLEIQFE